MFDRVENKHSKAVFIDIVSTLKGEVACGNGFDLQKPVPLATEADTRRPLGFPIMRQLHYTFVGGRQKGLCDAM